MTKFDDAYTRAQAMRAWVGTDDRSNPPFMTIRGIGKGGIVEPGNDDNVLAYAGMLAISGEPIGLSTAKMCQDSTGRLWRSPARLGVDTVDSISRDQLIGFCAYLVASKDVDAANKFLTYLEGNKWKLANDATDNRETMTLPMYGLLGYVWKYLGLKRNWRMILCMGPMYYLGQLGSAIFSPVSYQTELVSETVLVMRTMGRTNPINDIIAAILAKRDNQNAFYQYLNGNTDSAIDLALQQMPTSCPAEADIWSFAPATSSNQYPDCMGWDYIFLMNLIKDKLDAK